MPPGSFSVSSRSSASSSPCGARSAGSRRFLPLVLGVLALGAVPAARSVGPLAAWNHTPSLPEGLYVRAVLDRPAVGRIVAFPAPATALDYARRRGGSGDPTLFLKPLAAGPGDRVCVTDDLEINGRRLAPVLDAGPDGVPLPHWDGCRVLGAGEWFTFAPRLPNSLDGRYYGPIREADIVGVFRPVWTD
jgi:conjugative transfer signal peptidase TraF